MEKVKNRYGITIVVLLIFLLVLGWACTVAHYNNVVGEKDDKIEISTLQVLQAKGERKQALDDLKVCQDKIKTYQDKIDDFMYVWWNIKKVKLSDSKYFVGISENDFWMLVNEVDELNRVHWYIKYHKSDRIK